MIVFTMMFVLLTIVAGLHYRQMSSRSNLYHEDANLQARVAAEYEQARISCPNATFTPMIQVVQTRTEHSTTSDLPTLEANKLFATPGLTDVGSTHSLRFNNVPLQARSGMSWDLLQPRSSDPSVQPGRSHYISVTSNFFPYMACAPNGTITAKDTFAWRNQLFVANDSVPTQQSYSGGGALMAAQGDIQLGSCPYGELYTTNGTVTVEDGSFIAYQRLPGDLSGPAAYNNAIKSQVQAAMDKLSAQAQDKTSQLTGKALGPALFMELFRNPDSAKTALSDFLSLRNAMSFPFLMIPGVEYEPPVFVTIWLHMPFAPDFKPQAEKSDKEVERDSKLAEVKEQSSQLKDLQSQSDAETDPAKKKTLQKSIDDAKAKNDQSTKDLQKISGDLQKEMEDSQQSNDPDADKGPANRDAEDKLKLD
jgi:hypothetical protein